MLTSQWTLIHEEARKTRKQNKAQGTKEGQGRNEAQGRSARSARTADVSLGSVQKSPIQKKKSGQSLRRASVEQPRSAEQLSGADQQSRHTLSPPHPSRIRASLHTRIPAVLIHIPRYSFQGQARLARDVGVSRSTISRFLRGLTQPSYALVEAIAQALSRRHGQRLDPRELVSFDRTYPTASTCTLMGCPGCLPDEAYDASGNRLPEWKDAQPGDWSLAPESPVDSTEEEAA